MFPRPHEPPSKPEPCQGRAQSWNLLRLCKRLHLSFSVLFGQGRRQENALLSFFLFLKKIFHGRNGMCLVLKIQPQGSVTSGGGDCTGVSTDPPVLKSGLCFSSPLIVHPGGEESPCSRTEIWLAVGYSPDIGPSLKLEAAGCLVGKRSGSATSILCDLGLQLNLRELQNLSLPQFPYLLNGVRNIESREDFIMQDKQPLAHSKCLTKIHCCYSLEVTHFDEVSHDEQIVTDIYKV